MEPARKLDAGAYPVDVFVFEDVEPQDGPAVEAFLKERTGEDYEVSVDPSDAAATLLAGSTIVVLVAPCDDAVELAVTLCHESLHVVSYTWMITKQRLSAKHDEPVAYLLSHIFRQLLEG